MPSYYCLIKVKSVFMDWKFPFVERVVGSLVNFRSLLALVSGALLFLSDIIVSAFDSLGLLGGGKRAESILIFIDFFFYACILTIAARILFLVTKDKKAILKRAREEACRLNSNIRLSNQKTARVSVRRDHYAKLGKIYKAWSDQACCGAHRAIHDARDRVIRTEELRDEYQTSFKNFCVKDNAEVLTTSTIGNFYRDSLKESRIHCQSLTDYAKHHAETYLRSIGSENSTARVCIGFISSDDLSAKAHDGVLDIEDENAILEYSVFDSVTWSELNGHTKNRRKFRIPICQDLSLTLITNGDRPSFYGDIKKDRCGGIVRLEQGFATKIVLPIQFGSVNPRYESGLGSYNLFGFLTILVDCELPKLATPIEARNTFIDSMACFSDSLAIVFRSLHRSNMDLKLFCQNHRGTVEHNRRQNDKLGDDDDTRDHAESMGNESSDAV